VNWRCFERPSRQTGEDRFVAELGDFWNSDWLHGRDPHCSSDFHRHLEDGGHDRPGQPEPLRDYFGEASERVMARMEGSIRLRTPTLIKVPVFRRFQIA
jgi:hypothetical protein